MPRRRAKRRSCGEDRAVVRLVPGLDRPFRQAPVLVGHHEVEVDLDQVAEAVTGGAGPERVVEGEEAGLRLHEGPAAAGALEALRDAQRGPARHHGDRAAAPLPQRGLERVDEAPALPLPQHDPVDQHRSARRDGGASGSSPISTTSSPDQEAGVPALAQRRQGARRRAAPPARTPTRTRVPSGSPRRRSATLAAESRRTSSPHPSQTVRPARAKSSRRWSWISVAVATVERGLARQRPLADRDRGADPVHLVHPRLLHPLQELPGVRGEALDVAPLALGVEGVEGQAALPGAGDPGDDDQPAGRDRHVDPLQVVDADSPEDDVGGHGNCEIVARGPAGAGGAGGAARTALRAGGRAASRPPRRRGAARARAPRRTSSGPGAASRPAARARGPS